MGWSFWLKRFALALLVAAPLLLAVQLLKGHAMRNAMVFAAGWGLVSALLFSLTGYIRYRRRPACMLPAQRQKH